MRLKRLVLRGEARGELGFRIVRCDVCLEGPMEHLLSLPQFEIVRCSKCGLRSRSPLPDKDELLAWYADPAYREHPYFTDRRKPGCLDREDRLGLRTLSRLRVLTPQGRNLLDVGSGTGRFLRLAADAGWNVVGTELSDQAMDHLRDSLGIPLYGGFVEEIDFAGRTFDAITLWDVIEHVRSPSAVIRTLAALLNSGGVIYMYTPLADSLVRELARIPVTIVRSSVSNMVYPRVHLHYLARESARALFASHQMEIHNFTQYPFNPRRASHGTPATRPLWQALDYAGAAINRQYRLGVYAQLVGGQK
jgi:2-polyprenyl-3-methyl-5-hydroxy-6-metoxy-1,4-benzoquinol methylase